MLRENREAIIIDARDAEVYSGEIIEPFADKADISHGEILARSLDLK